MKRFKIVGLCLVAVFALTALVASSASAALPEYRACVKIAKNPTTKKYEGKYSVKTCATEASGTEQSEGKKNKYERKAFSAGKSAEPAFKGKNKGNPHNNLVDPTCPTGEFNSTTHKCNTSTPATASEPADIAGVTECTKEAVVGKLTSATNSTWKTEYQKCKALETPCNTKGEKAGVIVTQQLEASLVALNPSGTEPGLKVKGLGTKGELAQYECLGGVLNVEVFGEALAKQTGNTNSAEGKTKAFVEEGPLKLQSNTYAGPESVQTEESAKAFFIWGEKFQGCVVSEIEKGHSQAEAEGICFGKIGPPPATKPVMLESVTSLGTAPAVQNGLTENKGEKEILIETA
jgi:hypothetical protein